MRIHKIKYLVLFIFLAGCTQSPPPINLRRGITLLKGIEPSGLQFPLWSPDGKRIVASYSVEAMPDLIAFFGPEPRHDIVLIDTETWETSVTSQDTGMLAAGAWSPDSKNFAMSMSDGPNGPGMYAFNVEKLKPTFLFKSWNISPDWMRTAEVKGSYLVVTNTQDQAVDKFKLSPKGSWGIGDWSSDMKFVTLIYRATEKDRFENIYLLDLETGILSQFTNDDQYFKAFPTISPNGKLIAYRMSRFTENDFEAKMVISRLDRSCKWTLPIDDIDYIAWSPDNQKMFLVGIKGAYLADLDVILGKDLLTGNTCP